MDTAAFEKGATLAEKRINQTAKRFQAMGKSMSDIGGKMSIALTAPLAAFGVSSFKAASDAAELESAFNVTFGSMSAEMRKWARETGDALGRSTQEMQKAANIFGIFFNTAVPPGKAAAMSKTFSQLAQDLGSFFNVDTETAIDKLRAGLAGETEPLRAFGVFINEAALKTEGLRAGLVKAGEEMTEQQKIVARYNLILAATTKAQGDVVRTSAGTANQMRAAKAAFDELRVTIGTKLLPVITPLITKIADMLNAFSKLPDGVQTGVLAVAGLTAALGPLLFVMGHLITVFGTVVAATAPFTAALAAAFASGGVLVAAKAAIVGLTTAFAPFLIPIAAVAAAGLLIYKNWGTVGPVLERVSNQVSEKLGPAIAALGPAVREFATAAQGLAEKLAPLATALIALEAAILKPFGPVALQAIQVFIKTFSNALGFLTQQISSAAKLMQGDFVGAFKDAIGSVNALFGGLPKAAVRAVQELVLGVTHWIVGRLGAVWDAAIAKIERVKAAFRNMADAVVMNSYVPDMVDGIAAQMARLDAVMVNPAKTAAERTKQQFEKLANDVNGIMRRLFPEAAKSAGFAGDRAAINQAIAAGGASGFTVPQLQTALSALQGEEFREAFKDFQVAANDTVQVAETANVRIVQSFKDMADETLSALDRVAQAIKGGGFLNILSSVIDLGLQLGSIGAFGNKVQANINSAPKFASGTMSAPRGLALVGERGPELVGFSGGQRVFNNRESRAMMGGGQLEIRPSPLFEVYLDGKLVEAAPAYINGGASRAREMDARSRKWALA